VQPENSRDSHHLWQLRNRLQAESSDGLELLNNPTSNPICSVTLDDSVPCITVTWKQYATSTQLRFIHENLLQMLTRHRVSRILGDDTALPTIHAEDRVWITENWMPRARAAGLVAAASKRPDAYFGQLAVENVQSVAPTGVTLRSFDKLEDAREWLRKVSRCEAAE
jgi:hypothetical protein